MRARRVPTPKPGGLRVKGATIRDVARRARVSHQTVSRVINGQENVTAATRGRVLDAIRQLEYVPSAVARSLSSNRTHTLGMVTTDVSDHFFSEAVAGAEAEARKRGYFLIIGSIEEGSEDDERTYLRLMLERRVEGLIVAVPRLRIADDDILADAVVRIPTVLGADVDRVLRAKRSPGPRRHRRPACARATCSGGCLGGRVRRYPGLERLRSAAHDGAATDAGGRRAGCTAHRRPGGVFA